MKEPERLIHCGATDTERRLLVAGASEEPSAVTARHVAAIVGVSATVGIATNTAATAAPLAKLWLAKLQWLGVTLGAGGLAWLGYHMLQSTPASVPQAPATLSVRSPALTARSAPTGVTPRSVILEPLAAPAAAEVAKASAVARSARATVAGAKASRVDPEAEPAKVPESPARSTSIAAEVAAVDSARRALGRGDASQALRELNAYQAEYPRGVLGQEAALLRIEALAVGGNAGAAKALARRFFAAQPTSPHRKRIESIVGPLGPTSSGPR